MPHGAVFEIALLEALRMPESLINSKLLWHNIQQTSQIQLKPQAAFIIPPLR
jgi:hypothetical protein